MQWIRIGIVLALSLVAGSALGQTADCPADATGAGALCETLEEAARTKPADLDETLTRYRQGNSSPYWYKMGPGTRELIGAIEAVHYWTSFGQPEIAEEARDRAEALASTWGVDIQPELSRELHYRLFADRRDEEYPQRIATVHLSRRVGTGPPATVPDGAILRPNHTPLWWTGYPEAWIDIAYRVLPSAIENAYAERPSDPTFRVWHAGHEDASQTWLLAGIFEDIIPRLREQRPDMRDYLDALRVQIVGTDLMTQPVLTTAGEVAFIPHEKAPKTRKAMLIPEEFGAGADERVAAGADAIDGMFRKPADPILLRSLADQGGVARLLRGVLAPSTLVAYAAAQQPFFRPSGWTITDYTTGEARVFHEGHGNRTIEFHLADLTTAAPPAPSDVLVVTEVIPWLRLYAEAQRRAQDLPYEKLQAETVAAFENMVAGTRPNGSWIIDMHTAELFAGRKFANAEPFTTEEVTSLDAQMDAAGIRTWVTIPTQAETLEAYRVRERLPDLYRDELSAHEVDRE